MDVDTFVSARQEELGHPGCEGCRVDIAPDWAIASTWNTRPPRRQGHWLKTLGGGTVISAGPIRNRQLTALAITWLTSGPSGTSWAGGRRTGTNARSIQQTREGEARRF